MELPDCPPGAEGYEDSVVEMAKKPDKDETSCTKAEQEFQEHLESLKIRLDNGETRPMVERRGRDISGKWIYLCYPCAAVCSGELILQGHISGRKHKTKLGMRNAWPVSIFDDHPFNQSQKGVVKEVVKEKDTEKVLKKIKEEVDLHNTEVVKFENLFAKYRSVTCHIHYSMNAIKAPMIGIEYLIEHPPEEEHHEPSYLCTLCSKQGHPRTIINHMTCFWHRYNYINRHFQKAASRLKPLMQQQKYREGVNIVLNRLAASIENKYGRLRPLHIDKEVFEKDKDKIMQWIFKSKHLTEQDGPTFEDVVDPDLMEILIKSSNKTEVIKTKTDPSPPRVPAPNYKKGPVSNTRSYRKERRMSMDLSDISDDEVKRTSRDEYKSRAQPTHKPRWEPYQPKREPVDFKSRYVSKTGKDDTRDKPPRPPNYEYKMKLSTEKRNEAEAAAKKLLTYHEKNPEKHPLYPEEWKKFWNRRYKEIQTEGKDPSKHDFKPEWIVYWTKRMKELHDEELRVTVLEIYRKMNISPPNLNEPEPKASDKDRRRTPERRRSPEVKRFPDHIKRAPREDYRRSPERRRSREPRDSRREHERRRSPGRLRSSDRSMLPDYKIGRRSPGFRPIPEIRTSQDHYRSTALKGRSRSPLSRRSPPRTNIVLDSMERSHSPLSRRNTELPARNRSPTVRDPPPSLQTVLVSDDELKPDDSGLSPWNSDNDIESVCSVVEVRSMAGSSVSRHSRRRDVTGAAPRAVDPTEVGPVENVVATLRMMVALEDYLGSLGPKIVDLLTEALGMEKEKANSSEELLVRDSAMVMIETAKEKLKGAAQAGLVAAAAAPAVRAAVVRAAATMHEADKRRQLAQKAAALSRKTESVPVAGVGEVDRAQIAQQMAAALIAQGKTDVTSEELAQLVDAVVGMAEAKKKAELASKEVKIERPKPQPKLCGTATALQMLQSAYDENDKIKEDKRESIKEDVPDAMDGLSDSDLETLLKNFNELSAEEQHSLIAYLKKLEAREPQRVERLRQYVSAAASAPSPADAPPPRAPTPTPTTTPTPTPVPILTPRKETSTVVLESDDDDDYTVEEVIESAQQKVKEDQMRKEIEIVKKSLEELKENKAATPLATPMIDITQNLSSASDLLALVQASVQSKKPVNAPSAIATLASNTVVNTAQTRSFGDSLDSLANLQAAAPSNLEVPMEESPIENFDQQDQLPNNFDNTMYNQNDNYNHNDFNQSNNYQGVSYDQGGSFNQSDDYNQGDSYAQDGNSYDHSQTYHQNDNFNQSDSYQNQLYQNENYQNNQNQNQNSYPQSYNQNQNQNQSYVQPWNNNLSHGQDQGYNDFNQGQSGPPGGHNQFQPRGNFTNSRQDNQYGNYNNNNNNFRGRGRGNFNPRGRGRGRY